MPISRRWNWPPGPRGTFGQDTLVGGAGDDTILGDSDGQDDQGGLSGGAEALHATHRTDDDLTGGAGNDVLFADGRYAAFETRATNLVSGATSTDRKLVVRDLWTGVTAVVPTDADPDHAPLTAARAACSTDSTP